MEALNLKPGEERRLARGHLWVFSNETAALPATAQAGDLVRVVSGRGKLMGTALYSPNSLIIARMIGMDVEDLDAGFFRARISAAAALRNKLFPGSDCFRLVHGESDFLPGLIIDRYGSCFVIQTLTCGMDRRQSVIVEVLQELFDASAIVERNDTQLRSYEGLEQRKGVLAGRLEEPLVCTIEGLRYRLDLLGGQKTGLFLDQRSNRSAVGPYCAAASVLDCFCNVGGFSLHAAAAGAGSVVGVDGSSHAVETARANAELNGFSQTVKFIQGDVFDYLESARQEGTRFEVIILDPPSFAPRKRDVAKAKAAYRRLNQLALGLLDTGGILVTASCSFHLFEDVFYDLVSDAAYRAGRTLQWLERRYQAPDHPVLPAMPETAYLKLGVFRVR